MKYSKNGYCPLIFSRTQTGKLAFETMFNTVIYKNHAYFYEMKNYSFFDSLIFSSQIERLKLEVYNIEIITKILSSIVYNQTSYTILKGLFSNIQTDIFNDLKNLRRISFEIFSVN